MPRKWSVRSVTVCVSVLAVLGLAILPPEHLHARRSDGDHQRDVVHRHFEGHPSSSAGARVGHDEAAPRWLVSAYVKADSVTRLPRIDACIECDAPGEPPLLVSPLATGLVWISLHDPPPGAAFGLRAPPFPTL